MDEEEMNQWKGILIAVLLGCAIATVISLIMCAIFPTDSSPRYSKHSNDIGSFRGTAEALRYDYTGEHGGFWITTDVLVGTEPEVDSAIAAWKTRDSLAEIKHQREGWK